MPEIVGLCIFIVDASSVGTLSLPDLQGFENLSSLLAYLTSNPSTFIPSPSLPAYVSISTTRFRNCILMCAKGAKVVIADNKTCEDCLFIASNGGTSNGSGWLRIEGNCELKGVLAWDATLRFNASIGGGGNDENERCDQCEPARRRAEITRVWGYRTFLCRLFRTVCQLQLPMQPPFLTPVNSTVPRVPPLRSPPQ